MMGQPISLVALLLTAFPASAQFMEFVPVGNAGNAPDPASYEGSWGAVASPYEIGTYEVTHGQYTAFLNAVAATDTHGLYDPYMAVDQHGAPGAHSYTVGADWADRPVVHVNFGDAARFANWMHNGMPAGSQDASTTEDGAYHLAGAVDDAGLSAVTRDANAIYFIPSRDEWHKAAYHKNDGVTGNYWVHPTSSDEAPSFDETEAQNPGNNANYRDPATGLYVVGPPYYLSVAGEFELTASPYGASDMAGNVYEWNDTIPGLLRGGNFTTGPVAGKSTWGGLLPPTTGDGLLGGKYGFRMARRALGASPSALSLSAGGVQTMQLAAPVEYALQPYFLLGSTAGTAPGLPVGAHVLPLNVDAYFNLTLTSPNLFPLGNTFGVLDSGARATATFTLVPASPAQWAGAYAHHAFAVLQLAPTVDVVYVSNAVGLQLLP